MTLINIWQEGDQLVWQRAEPNEVEPCPACEEGLIHNDDSSLLVWTCDHCGYHQVDELEEN